MRLSHAWRASTAVFDDENLVSCAGLAPVLELGEQTGLSVLLDEHVVFTDERVRSGAANPVPKLCSIIAGMLAGADSIDDLDVIRSGGMKRIFTDVYASATLGIFLREFTLGHVRQLGAVLRRHLPALADRTDVLAGIDDIALVDIDSLLRPVYGHGKQGASFGHTKIGSRLVLRLDIPRPQRVKRCVAGRLPGRGDVDASIFLRRSRPLLMVRRGLGTVKVVRPRCASGAPP